MDAGQLQRLVVEPLPYLLGVGPEDIGSRGLNLSRSAQVERGQFRQLLVIWLGTVGF